MTMKTTTKALDEPEASAGTSGAPDPRASSQGTEADRHPPRRVRNRPTWRFLAIGIGLIALLAVALLAFGGQAGGSDSPPTITYGEDTCVRCGMIIDDPRVAAAYRTAGGEARLFDGIDEMVLGYRERHDKASAFYVHDYGSGDWLRAEGAFFVVGTRPGPTMGSSVVAASTEDEARALADRLGGRVVTFSALLEGTEIPSGGGHMGH